MATHGVLLLSALVISAYASSPVLPVTDQPGIGPIYLPPANGSFSAFEDARARAKAAIDEAVASGQSQYGAIDGQATSFSISVFSTNTEETLFTYHFEAPALNGSLTRGELSDRTIYRTGSLGKLMSVYQFLVDVGDSVYLDPITKYIPELANAPFDNPLEQVNWEEITIASLAAQISGLGRDFRLADYAIGGITQAGGTPEESAAFAVANGFPPPEYEIAPECAYYSYELTPCDQASQHHSLVQITTVVKDEVTRRAAYLRGLIDHPPAFPSYTKASYSNIAYPLLAIAYQAITGKTFEDGFNTLFRDRLGLNSTYFQSPPSDIDAIIPYNDTFASFTHNIGLQSPSGGQYVSTRDLQTWGRAILQSTLLPKATTRRWIQTHSVTSQWGSNVGAPWEVFRLPIPVDPTLNTTRIIDIYSKGGDVGSYSTWFGLVPDHEIGLIVLAAGEVPNAQVQPLKSIVADVFINATEAAAKEQARRAFTGTFRASDSNLNSSITLEVDSGPGVVITEWISNGTDFKNSPLIGAVDARMYPSGLKWEDPNGSTWQSFRALLLPGRPLDAEDLWPQFKDAFYFTDSGIYDNRASDAFNVELDQNGFVRTVESHSLRIKLSR